MHTVVLTPTFLRQDRACGVDEGNIDDIVNVVALDPIAGDIIAGTGGARKVRHTFHNQGKSGGICTIHYFAGEGVPIFLLSAYARGTKANLTKAERNELAALLPMLARSYRSGKEL